MKKIAKKEYINPVSIVITIPHMALLNSSPLVPYDPNGTTDEALSPFLELDGIGDETLSRYFMM